MDYELMMNGNVKIGQKAPDFEATTSCGPVSLNDYKGKWLVFFSHPRRFYPNIYTFQTFFGRIKKLDFYSSNFIEIVFSTSFNSLYFNSLSPLITIFSFI